MDKELKEEIIEHIEKYIKYAFEDWEEICLNFYDEIEDGKIKEEWLKREVKKRYEKQLEKEKDWQTTTFDKLVSVFDTLSTRLIISLHMAGVTRQDGEYIASATYDELEEKGIEAEGYCYYHTQDVELAIGDNQKLYIRYGDFQGDNDKCQQVGKLIVTELRKHNFEVHWSESINTAIEIKPFLWQKRHDGIDYSSKRTMAHILATQTKSS
ncbi:DUF6891 domain-containing protein [Xanthocytophaga flava]|uniref:DUF6891 domain-containing protein n=1 Tax=Xanthocytophaga flava TaxID=3048013 RepID=UPI0028D7E82C|nr:hypothetical protein [Xanthocytophaga flavus]MDJ1471917.1 hypothetical protein [Xanthocytophaga flavus]